MICGHPGETDEDFAELLQFFRDYPFERLGAFVYSPEPGTPAAEAPDQVPEALAMERFDRLMRQQQSIAFTFNQRLVGRTVEILVDRVKGKNSFARTQYDAPDIDPQVIVRNQRLMPGRFYTVRISGTRDYDLLASLL